MAYKAAGTTIIDDGRGLININSGLGVGIQSGGSVVGHGITQLNFIGAGNTFAVHDTTVNISIAGGGGGGGALGTTGITTQTILSTPNSITDDQLLTFPGHNYGVFGPVSVGAAITVGVGNTFVII
jgi:hypothetical protein